MIWPFDIFEKKQEATRQERAERSRCKKEDKAQKELTNEAQKISDFVKELKKGNHG